MEKHILRFSYWLGVICVALAVIARILNMAGLSTIFIPTRGNPISFRSFVDGAILFLLAAIASAGALWFKKQNS
jgi:hypothetical protein